MNTFTETMAKDLGPATKPVGLEWLQSLSSRPEDTAGETRSLSPVGRLKIQDRFLSATVSSGMIRPTRYLSSVTKDTLAAQLNVIERIGSEGIKRIAADGMSVGFTP